MSFKETMSKFPKDFLPEFRTTCRGWKHSIEETWQEVRFDCQPDARRLKKEQLQIRRDFENLYTFAYEEFAISQIKAESLSLLGFLKERSPRIIGEIGTYMSGNSFLFNQVCGALTLQVLVDLKVKNKSKLRFYTSPDVTLVCVNGYSTDPYSLHQVARGLGDEVFDFLFIDGDHEYEGALQDLICYTKWLRPGAWVGFHDIVSDHFVRYGKSGPYYAGEVYLLWKQLKRRFRHWEFIADQDQNGAGIGIIEFDEDAERKILEIRSFGKNGA